MKILLSTPLPSPPIRQVVQRILRTGRITLADQQRLLQANATSSSLNDEDMKLVRQVWDRLQMGLVKVTD